MPADVLWQITLRLLRPTKPAGTRFELMNNEDIDRWLEEHRPA